MSVLFFIPLTTIALYEAELDPSKNKWIKDWLSHPDQGLDDVPEHRDPVVDGPDADKGWEISKVKFDELVKMFPDTTHVSLWFLTLTCVFVRLMVLVRCTSRARRSFCGR